MNDEDNVTGGDLAKSITFEVAANSLLDKYSGLLLAAPDPTQASKILYALANIGGSAAINYFAQRIRGGKFNLGELLTAGGLSLIPGGVQAKTLKGRVARGATKGAGLGALQVTGESLINEQKLPKFEEALLGAGFGGTLGGALSGVSGPEASKFVKALKNRIKRKKLVVQEIKEQVAQQKPQKNLGGYMDDEGIDIEDYGFGPEGPRGGATDDQIMQAYREITGELQLDPNRVENRTRTSSLTGPNPNLLNMVQSPSGSGPTGKITWRNIPKLDRFLSGQTTSLDRTTAGLIQNPNFKLGDFLQGIDQELERVRRQYPNIDVDTNLQRFKWQWHHINPDKMPADFYVGLNNVADRDLITDTLLRETNVSAGMNPSNRIGLPTEVHDEITDWLNEEIGRRSEVITQKISDDFGFGLTLTGPGSRAAKLRFNQLFAQVPVQQRIPYIIEYGQKIAESSQILDELMRQFDIFYDIPNGFRLDIDVNTMERMLARLDEGLPTIQTLRDIIEEVTDGMRIPVTNDLGVQGIAQPRDPNLIRAIDIEGMLRDHKAGQSVLNDRQIKALGKELNQIYQMDLDIKGASASAYIQAWYNDRFGGTRRSGTRTGPN
tara:strand:+ start:38 stop:1858 length:1821 start_codon:yes stop_codon:yes gene_type:complete